MNEFEKINFILNMAAQFIRFTFVMPVLNSNYVSKSQLCMSMEIFRFSLAEINS